MAFILIRFDCFFFCFWLAFLGANTIFWSTSHRWWFVANWILALQCVRMSLLRKKFRVTFMKFPTEGPALFLSLWPCFLLISFVNSLAWFKIHNVIVIVLQSIELCVGLCWLDPITETCTALRIAWRVAMASEMEGVARSQAFSTGQVSPCEDVSATKLSAIQFSVRVCR